MGKYIYGIDIGGTTIKFGLFSKNGKLLKKWEILTNSLNHGESIVQDIYQSILKATPNLSDVLGYGFGVPGPVVDNTASVVVNLGWVNVNLNTELRHLLDNDNIKVANDANVATLGEATYGAGKGKSQVAMLTLGTGVGGGLVVDGKVIEGLNGAAGEIGHLNVHPTHEFACKCGNSGCLETVASATGIRNIYYKLKETYPLDTSLSKLKLPSAKAIFSAARRKDELAMNVVDEAARYIGYACNVLGLITNPEVIVIGGGVSKAGDFLLDKVQKHFINYCMPVIKNTKIVTATLGNDAGIYGAARMIING